MKYYVQLLLLSMLVASVMVAQLTVSTIRGTVTDPTGSAVPGATVEVRNEETGLMRQTITSREGFYEVPDLQRGRFSVKISAPGFTTFEATQLALVSSQIRRVDAQLAVGTVETVASVVADAAVISTEGAKQQSSLSNRDYIEKPWIGNGINPLLLLTANPLVQNTGGIFGIQVSGQPTAQIQSTIDGVGGDATLNGTNVHFYEEVNVVTGNNSAEFPRAAQISMVSRSGSNKFRGVMQYWHQNSALNAREYFAPTKPVAITHNMLAEASGPIIKNRTFFLYTWEGQRIPASTFYLRDVPTVAMRNGDFSQFLTGTSPVLVRDPSTGANFPGNVVPASRVSPVARRILDTYLPAPNQGAPNALNRNYGFLFPYPTDLYSLDNQMIRMDHRINSKNSIFSRWQFAKPLYVLNGNYETTFWTRIRRTYNFAVEDTHIFSPRLVNTARFGLYQPTFIDGETVDGQTPPKGGEIAKALGIQGVNDASRFPQAGFPTMSITGYPAVTAPHGGFGQNYKEFHFTDTFSATLGRHFVRTGGELRVASQFNGAVPDGTFGNFAFNGSITRQPFADFLLGIPFSSTRVNPITDRTQQDGEFGAFVQDTFRVNRKLTLDLGVRWDRFGKAGYEDNLVFNWDRQANTVIVPQESLGKVSPLYPSNIRVAAGEARQEPSNSNFAPRFGGAYLLTPKWVIRGGYGVFIETLGRFARAQGGGPYQIAEQYFNLQAPYFSFPNPFPANLSATVPSQNISGFPTATENGKIHQFNATVERQIADIGLRLSYFGSRSRDLNYSIAVNKPEPSGTPFTAARRPYQPFVGATFTRNDGAANYDALTIQAQRRTGAFTFNAHYTLANNVNKQQNLENPYQPLGWARDLTTIRNRAVINVDYRLPFGRKHSIGAQWPVLLDAALGGWQLDWMTYLESGQYFTPSFAGSDPSNTNTVGGIPDRIGNGNLPAGERTTSRWFDARAFAVPRTGTFGNSGTGVLEGPGLQLHNLSVNKQFAIKEFARFSLGVAVQNAFNHPGFAIPAANISVPGSVGVISSTRAFGGARQLMLRGRFEF